MLQYSRRKFTSMIQSERCTDARMVHICLRHNLYTILKVAEQSEVNMSSLSLSLTFKSMDI